MLQIEYQVLILLLFFLCLVFLAFLFRHFLDLLLLGLLLSLFALGQQRQFLLVHHKAVVGIGIEEHDELVTLRSPGAVAAITRTVALENHGLTVEYPFRTALAVTAVCQIVNHSGAVGLDQSDVLVVPSAHTDILREQPLAIRTPGKVLISVSI